MSFDGQWKRYSCCPQDQDDIPDPLSNMLVFELSNYFYRTLPTWFDSTGRKLPHTRFVIDTDNLLYKWTFYKKDVQRLSDMIFYISTYEDIMPVIYEVVSGTRMNVRRISRHNGYSTFMISC
jgi:hypothetical protein